MHTLHTLFTRLTLGRRSATGVNQSSVPDRNTHEGACSVSCSLSLSLSLPPSLPLFPLSRVTGHWA